MMPDMSGFEPLQEDNDLSRLSRRYFTYLFTIKHRDDNYFQVSGK